MRFNKILLTIFTVLFVFYSSAQITTAVNGLNTPTSTTIGLGGTLDNAQTSIDFGSANANSSLLIKKGTTSHFFISNGGSVGIGTMSFTGNEKLKIAGDAVMSGLTLSRTVSSSDIPAYQSGISSGIFNRYTINLASTYGFNYNYASDNSLTIQGFGNTVGGYQSAGARNQLYLNNVTLAAPSTGHIWSAATNSLVTQSSTASKLINTFIKSQFVSSTITNYYDLYIESPALGVEPTTHWAIFQEDGNAKSYVAGKVGFGTTTPTAYLHIKAGTVTANTAPLKFTSGPLLMTPEAGAIEYDGSHLYFTAANSGTRYQLDQQGGGGGTNYWALSGTNVSVANTSYNVGIGTSNPGPYKLAVEGTLGARKIKVTLANPWADYVFEDGYKLLGLEEVERYIEQHKHLPDVPSAKEVEKDGLDLGDNQSILLKKIEELTLYVIDQNKKIEEQNKKVIEQDEKIKRLEDRLNANKSK